MTTFSVWVDHGYEGESDHYFDTLAAAAVYASTKRSDPYVMRVVVGDESGDAVCEHCGTVYAYDSDTEESVCRCGRTL